MRHIVFGLLIFGVAIGVVLVFAQAPFAASAFEYQQYRDYKGVLINWPYPMLITGADRFLLVDPGKHGASTNGLAGKTVELKGALIHRGTDRMLELLPGSLRAVADSGASETRLQLGEITLTGEIVDSKCYLGVMNPGQGKVHRDCAARCISGGSIARGRRRSQVESRNPGLRRRARATFRPHRARRFHAGFQRRFTQSSSGINARCAG